MPGRFISHAIGNLGHAVAALLKEFPCLSHSVPLKGGKNGIAVHRTEGTLQACFAHAHGTRQFSYGHGTLKIFTHHLPYAHAFAVHGAHFATVFPLQEKLMQILKHKLHALYLTVDLSQMPLIGDMQKLSQQKLRRYGSRYGIEKRLKTSVNGKKGGLAVETLLFPIEKIKNPFVGNGNAEKNARPVHGTAGNGSVPLPAPHTQSV